MFPIHPVALNAPEMPDDQFNTLVASIQFSGQQEPALIYQNQIIDGRHRQKACTILGIPLITAEWFPKSDDPESELAAISDARNFARRHLSPSQQALAAARFYNNTKGKKPITQKQAADKTGVSERQVKRAVNVTNNATPEIIAKVEAGELSLDRAERIIQKVPRRHFLPKHKKGKNKTTAKTLANSDPDNKLITTSQPPPNLQNAPTTLHNTQFESQVTDQLQALKSSPIASQQQITRISSLINRWTESANETTQPT